ncbi:hypothetical protein B0F90DRAFT_1666464 [Multifurca ochricompacta]|uniref:Uncharacterized protein n=1 Tax=Multifurca ochricompacta TaxID=376703 RepID=A0AAD4M894_9AGAM|nr:hypothetical protein B0F90DRAFT_1666464 [Multifurca ochricompacta]
MTAHPRSLSGPHPGQFDKTQTLRVLRHPDARLSFASFHPLTASNVLLYIPPEGSSNPKRIVIETHPSGHSHWRFVPRARLAEGVSDEGLWPRLVDVLGNLIICDQDQWDIYKLDPFYDCFVPAPPQPPTIRAKVTSAPSFTSFSASSHSSTSVEGPQKKRRLSTPYSSLEEDNRHSPKKRRHVIHVLDSDSDDVEVEAIINPNAPRPTLGTRVPGRRVHERNGGAQHVPIARTMRANVRDTPPNETPDEDMRPTIPSSPPLQPTAAPSTSKRRNVDVQGASPTTMEDDFRFKPSKRARTHSPDSVRRGVTSKLKERARVRTAEFTRRMNAERDARRDARDQALMEDIIAEMPEDYIRPYGGQMHDDDQLLEKEQDKLTEALNELRMHEELLAESRRKIAELERDRPLWEAAARARERREGEEEEERRAAHERRRCEEAAARARAEEERREAERERSREAAQAEAEAAKRRTEAQRARWAQGPWTSQRALERYRTLCETFDSAAKPALLTFEDIPWPTLRAPYTFGPEDIDWAAVESFFHTVRGHMRAQDYRVFVEKSHRRFHPDRWRARGLLTAVRDENARGMIEVAANTVAQALTPLWREARGP